MAPKPDDYQRGEVEFFNASLAEHGESFKALRWGSEASQTVRFQALARIGDLAGCRVLDIGCGFGDLFGYLRKQGTACDYHGVDINSNLLAVARKKYPEARFSQADILADGWSEKGDYVLSSGLFGMGVTPWTPFVEAMLERMFALAERGLGFNMQSSWSPECYPNGLPTEMDFDPLRWLDYCRQRLSRRIAFHHDYLPHDYTVFVYPEAE